MTDYLYKVQKIVSELDTLGDAGEIMGACFAHVNVHWDNQFDGKPEKSATLPKDYFNPPIREKIYTRENELWKMLKDIVDEKVAEIEKFEEGANIIDDDNESGNGGDEPTDVNSGS